MEYYWFSFLLKKETKPSFILYPFVGAQRLHFVFRKPFRHQCHIGILMAVWQQVGDPWLIYLMTVFHLYFTPGGGGGWLWVSFVIVSNWIWHFLTGEVERRSGLIKWNHISISLSQKWKLFKWSPSSFFLLFFVFLVWFSKFGGLAFIDSFWN